MDETERALQMWRLRLRTEALGPMVEWDAVPCDVFQRRHDEFWKVVSGIIATEDGDYEDIPEWMSEIATEALQANS